MPPDSTFPPFQDFEVVHDYLTSSNPKIQSRLRKRGQNGQTFKGFVYYILNCFIIIFKGNGVISTQSARSDPADQNVN